MRHSTAIRIGPVGFRIGSEWRGPIAAVERLYAGYPGPRDGIADFTVRLEAERAWRRFLRPSVAIRGDYTLPDAAPVALEHGLLAAEMGMNLQMALGHRRHLLLHAASAEKDGRAVLMTGVSGAGKSTLAMLLGEAGWRLMGDEFALLDLDDGTLHPFPRAVSLKNEAVALATDEGRLGPVLEGTPKGTIRHFRPNTEAIRRMDEPARPVAILFPRFGHAEAVRPVGAAEVFMRLTQASTNYVALGRRGFKALTKLVTDVSALAVDYPNSGTALQMIDTLWAERGS